MADVNAPPEVAAVLDVRGLACPLPILRTKVALRQVPVGAVLRVHATDPMAVVDFRAYCARTGHELLRLDEAAAESVFWIRRVAPPAA